MLWSTSGIFYGILTCHYGRQFTCRVKRCWLTFYSRLIFLQSLEFDEEEILNEVTFRFCLFSVHLYFLLSMTESQSNGAIPGNM